MGAGLSSCRSDSCCLLLLVYGHASILLLHRLALDLVLILVLQPVELVVLQQDTLLNHGLVRLREEVVLLHVHLVWWDAGYLSHVPLQRVLRVVAPALQTFRHVLTGLYHLLMLLVLLAAAYLLLVHARELLGCALLDRVRL